eukprot:Em0012g292a
MHLALFIIYSCSVKEHLTRLAEVLGRLKQAGMKLKSKKCRLLRKKVNYLGYVVSSDRVQTDPQKVDCILNWPTPVSQKELRQFLGLASYYRRFVKGFAGIAAPLNRLLEKGKPWMWSKECEVAFSSLKGVLTIAPVLVYPHYEFEFIVDCDASDDGVGAVLSQCINDSENVISYASRALTTAERKYCATQKEMLALVWAAGQFRPYLLGRPFTVRKDHSALQWLYSFKEPEGQVARWLESLAEYDLKVQHRPGKKHTNADAMSRLPGQLVDVNVSNTTSVPNSNWLPCLTESQIHELQDTDEDIKQVIDWVEHPNARPNQRASHVLKSVWAQKKYLEELARPWKRFGPGFIRLDNIMTGKNGVTKAPPKQRHAPLQIHTATAPMDRVAMDILGPLPITPRQNKFGAPTHLHTEQGRSFELSLIKEIYRMIGIVKTRTTPYHPQSDGMMERFNRTLLSMLRMAAMDDETNWDLRIQCLMLAYRTSIHEATKHTPFSLMFGREVQLPIDVMYGLPACTEQPVNVPLFVKDLRKWMSEAYERVRSHLSSEQRRHKQIYDVKVAGKPFTRGSKMWMEKNPSWLTTLETMEKQWNLLQRQMSKPKILPHPQTIYVDQPVRDGLLKDWEPGSTFKSTHFEHSEGDCDVPDELVNDLEGPDVDCNVIAHGSGTRVSSHATTDVDSDENSEDDSDVGSDESYISSDVGRDVGRDVDSAMQDGDVRVICDEVTDAQDLRAPTMQECVPEAVFSAAGSSTDCSPCIVNSIKQHLDMRIESKTALWNMSVEYCKSIVTDYLQILCILVLLLLLKLVGYQYTDSV